MKSQHTEHFFLKLDMDFILIEITHYKVVLSSINYALNIVIGIGQLPDFYCSYLII